MKPEESEMAAVVDSEKVIEAKTEVWNDRAWDFQEL